jgi:acyl-coenzyme A thioesterase PaaI-like protein
MASNYRRQTIQQRVNRDDVLRQLDADSDCELSEIASDYIVLIMTQTIDVHDEGGVVQGGAVQAGVGVEADDDPYGQAL